MTTLRAVCFDLDGTLIDSDESIVASFFYTCDKLGIPRPDRKAIIGSIGYLLEDQIAQLTDYDPHEFARVYREYYGQICCGLTQPMPGARETLQTLRAAGFLLGFATSKRRYYAEQILRHLGLLDFFEARVGGEDVEKPKPDPEPLQKVADMLGIRLNEMVLVGDTRFDVLAAQNAGVKCLCVTLGYEDRSVLESLQPEGIFESLEAVTAYLMALKGAAETKSLACGCKKHS